MAALWSPQNKTQKWLDVEIAVCAGLEHFGKIPAGTTEIIRAGAKFDLDRIAELEKETRHDVMAFVKLTRKLGSPFSLSQAEKERRTLPVARWGRPRSNPTSGPVDDTMVMSVLVA